MLEIPDSVKQPWFGVSKEDSRVGDRITGVLADRHVNRAL